MFLISIGYGDEKQKIEVTLKYYTSQNAGEAIEALNVAELDEAKPINVLVSAPDVRALEKAYPNYFGSTTKFTDFIKEQLK